MSPAVRRSRIPNLKPMQQEPSCELACMLSVAAVECTASRASRHHIAAAAPPHPTPTHPHTTRTSHPHTHTSTHPHTHTSTHPHTHTPTHTRTTHPHIHTPTPHHSTPHHITAQHIAPPGAAGCGMPLPACPPRPTAWTPWGPSQRSWRWGTRVGGTCPAHPHAAPCLRAWTGW